MTAFVISNAGGNWNAPGSYVANSGFPVAGDTVTATGTSGNLTVNVASACASLILTNYTNTLTMTNSLTMTSTLTLVSGQANLAGTGAFIMNGTLTITSGGKAIPTLTLQGANTYTIGDDVTVNTTLTVGTSSNAITLTGSHNLSTNNNLTFGTTGTVTFSGLTALNMKGTGALTLANVTLGAGTINFQSAGSTITLSGTGNLNGATLSYTSGPFSGGSSTLNISGSSTLTLGSSAHLNNVTFTAASTLTLGADLYVDGTLTFGNVADGFAGAFNLIVGTVAFTAPTASRTHTMVQSQTLTINTAFNGPVASTNAVRCTFVSSSPGTKWKLILANGATHSLINWFNITDCDATGGQTLFDAGGTVTTCFNIQNAFAPVQLRREPIMQLVH